MKRKARRLVGLAVGATILAATGAAPSSAEQISSGPSATTGLAANKQLQAGHAVAPTQAKPARPQRAATAPSDPQENQWSIKDALPSNSSALSSGDTESKTKTAIGRIPWRSGTVGFETESKIKPTEYPDGQKVPGYETGGRQPPSYLGFSLSVPTSDKSMLPLFSHPD
jgi:hypothetical protein